jgi:hypothetical protein
MGSKNLELGTWNLELGSSPVRGGMFVGKDNTQKREALFLLHRSPPETGMLCPRRNGTFLVMNLKMKLNIFIFSSLISGKNKRRRLCRFFSLTQQ